MFGFTGFTPASDRPSAEPTVRSTETRPVCPTCGAAWVWASDECWTLVGYVSPLGHSHDDNCRVRVYRCARGHEHVWSVQATCPACAWVGSMECFCHEGPKLREWPEAKGE